MTTEPAPSGVTAPAQGFARAATDPTVTMQPRSPAATLRPFVVRGDNPLAFRLVEMLTAQYDGFVIAVVQPGRNPWVARMRELANVQIIEAETLDRQVLVAARIGEAEALALVEQDDAANVQAALLAQEINPDVRLVIRMAKQSLGDRIGALLKNATVYSASAIAAPAFVAAALGVAATPPIQVGDRTVVGILRERTRPEDILAGLAVMGPRGSSPEVLAADVDERADLVLARSKPSAPPRPPRTSGAGLVLSLLFGRRMRVVLVGFLLVFALGTAALAILQRDSTWGDAAYSALITALTGNAEGTLSGAGPRTVAIVLTVVSIALIPAITATIVDALVKLRLQRQAGGLYDPIADHTVVIGLGDLGTRVVRALHAEGVAVVAVERDPDSPGVQVARDLQIPVIIGEASRAETHERASVATAQTMIVLSTDDVTNLEVGLLGLSANPNLRVVLRLFDGDFADRVRKAFNIATSRSVSYLAAPTFAAAMIGRTVLATIPVRRRVLLLAELPIGDGCELEHQTVAAVNQAHETKLLAIRTADQVLWRPSEGRPLRSTDKIIVVATRAGLSQLLAQTEPGSAGPATPYRLLQPWELPPARTDAGSGETAGQASTVRTGQPGPSALPGPAQIPPSGPTDTGSTRHA